MEHIIHLPEYHVVVCKKCKYAILPTEISSHFTPTRPHGFPKEARQEIINRVAQIPGLIKDEEELEHRRFPFPIDTSKPVVGLDAPKIDGFRCTIRTAEGICPYVGKDVRRIQEHCHKRHDWINPKKAGRPRKSDVIQEEDMPWRSGVKYQRFFKQGAKSGYFEVGRDVQVEDSSNARPKTTWEIFQEKASHEFRRIEEIQQRKIEATDESREVNP
jgi:Orsellinic acid/F9775 biosynthesis cluster protein D